MPRDVEEGLLLPGERRVGQVLGGRARPHGEGQPRRRPPASCVVRRRGCRPRGRRGTAARRPPSRISLPTSASARTSSVSRPASSRADPLGQPGVADEAAVGVGGGGEAVRAPAPRRRPGWRPSRRARRSCRRPARGRPARARRTTGRCCVMTCSLLRSAAAARVLGSGYCACRVCMITVDISSTDLAEELIDGDAVRPVHRLGPAQLVACTAPARRSASSGRRSLPDLAEPGRRGGQPEAAVAQVAAPAAAGRWSRSPRRPAGSWRRRGRAAGRGTSSSASCRSATARAGSRRPCPAPRMLCPSSCSIAYSTAAIRAL